jgi:hypothetical protein
MPDPSPKKRRKTLKERDTVDWESKPRTAKKQPEGDRASTSRIIQGRNAPLTRQELGLHSNAYYDHRHMQLPPTWEGDKRKYATYLRKLKKWKEDTAAYEKAHGKTGGTRRRHRKHRSTRRR